jgi:hypothetical protein
MTLLSTSTKAFGPDRLIAGLEPIMKIEKLATGAGAPRATPARFRIAASTRPSSGVWDVRRWWVTACAWQSMRVLAGRGVDDERACSHATATSDRLPPNETVGASKNARQRYQRPRHDGSAKEGTEPGELLSRPRSSVVNYPTLLALTRSLRVGLPASKTRFAGTGVVPAGSAVSTGVPSE